MVCSGDAAAIPLLLKSFSEFAATQMGMGNSAGGTWGGMISPASSVWDAWSRAVRFHAHTLVILHSPKLQLTFK